MMSLLTRQAARRAWLAVVVLALLLPLSPGTAPEARAAAPAIATMQTYGVDDVDSLSIDQRLLLVSLQGIVNREGPVLWLRSGIHQSPGLLGWETILPELRTQIHISFSAALERFARPDHFTGVVVVDPAIEETYNIATNLAGQENLLIATPATLGELHLPIKHDLRGRYPTENEAFAANLALYRTANHRMALKAVRWSARDYLYRAPERGRDLAIQQRYWTFSKSVRDADLLTFYQDQISDVRTLYGSSLDENLNVYRASQSGKVWLGMDLQLQYNLSFFNQVPGQADFAYRQPPIDFTPIAQEPGKGDTFVAFVMTEGDNPFFMINQMKINWANPDRGRVPIGWTIAPRMLELAPAVLQYFYATASPNDYFLAGASGVAYYHVNAMDYDRYPGFLDSETPQTLRRLDIRIIRNFGDWLGVQMSFYNRLLRIAQGYPELLGWIEGHGIPLPSGTALPYERTTAVQLGGQYLDIPFSAWCDSDLDVPRTVASIRAFAEAHPDRPLQIMVGMDQKRTSPSTVQAIVSQLGSGYRYVRPDILYRSRPTEISAVASPRVQPNSVLITWATDELATGEVVLSGPAGSQTIAESSSAVTSHQISIGRLAPATQYTYYVRATDADRNITRSANYHFTTLAAPPAAQETRRWLVGLGAVGIGILLLITHVSVEWRRRTRRTAG